MAAADDAKFEFTKLLDGIAGAEGPVFDTSGNFYMVAPEVEKNNKFAGQILKVDLATQKVCGMYVVSFKFTFTSFSFTYLVLVSSSSSSSS